MPNVVIVSFRGTYSAKAAGSYVKPSSINPTLSNIINLLTTPLGKKGKTDKFLKEYCLFGINKLLMDVIHNIMNSITYVASKIKEENPDNNQTNKTRIITTGHSLGGGLASLFAYYYATRICKVDDFKKNFNKDIVCLSLGSPRVFGKETSQLFCWLTKNNETLLQKDGVVMYGYKNN